jgi:iron only hydrogenase large subunit-like protein
MGSLVKTHLSGKLGVSRDKIFHLSVMPCFDKKLEASREAFKDDVTATPDVDLVITAVELEQVRFLSASKNPHSVKISENCIQVSHIPLCSVREHD